MSNTTRSTFIAIAALTLVLSACSSGESDSTTANTATAGTEATATETTEAATAPTTLAAVADEEDFSSRCEEFAAYGATLRGGSGWIPQVVDDEIRDLNDLSDGILAAVEGLREIEHLEGPLGTISESLDNLEADAIAVAEGRYDEYVGNYKVSAINGLIVDTICG